MAWSRFTYWMRGETVKPPLKKVPKGSNKPLVYHQMMNGDFDPSPYLLMVEEEDKRLEKEVSAWKKKNNGYSKELFDEWYRGRKAVYNTRKFKLEKEHWEYDRSRMELFKKGLRDAFLLDLWDQILEKSSGDVKEFYDLYASEASRLKAEAWNKTKNQTIT